MNYSYVLSSLTIIWPRVLYDYSFAMDGFGHVLICNSTLSLLYCVPINHLSFHYAILNLVWRLISGCSCFFGLPMKYKYPLLALL